MKIFQMRTAPHGVERFQQFTDENFVCIGWPGLGNLEGVTKDELRDRIKHAYETTGHKAGNTLGLVNAFVNTMQKGDLVIVANKGYAYFATVGDYEYEPKFDNDSDGMCHRRRVQWLGKLPRNELNASVQALLRSRNTIAEYPKTVEESELEHILSGLPLQSANNNMRLKLDSLFETALGILEDELHSESPDRRLKAAAELLKLKKGAH